MRPRGTWDRVRRTPDSPYRSAAKRATHNLDRAHWGLNGASTIRIRAVFLLFLSCVKQGDWLSQTPTAVYRFSSLLIIF